MKVLVVSGIWPPDIGGPASHAPELSSWLQARGHKVEAVITAASAPQVGDYPVRWVSRRLPPGLRHAAVVRLVAARARRADVVYATSMVGRTMLAAALARRPYVAKIAGDAAFERARRSGLSSATLSEFQRSGGVRSRVLRAVRDRSVHSAAAVVCPSTSMRDLVVSWGVDPRRVFVLPNPAPSPGQATPVDVGDGRPCSSTPVG